MPRERDTAPFYLFRSVVGSGCAEALAAAEDRLCSSVLEVLHHFWCGEGLWSPGNVTLWNHQPFNAVWGKSQRYTKRKQENLTGSRSWSGNLEGGAVFRCNQITLGKGKKRLPSVSWIAVTWWETKGLSSDFSSSAATLLETPRKSQWPDANYSFTAMIVSKR